MPEGENEGKWELDHCFRDMYFDFAKAATNLLRHKMERLDDDARCLYVDFIKKIRNKVDIDQPRPEIFNDPKALLV